MVVGVRHERADVVRQRRVVEQLALLVAERVKAGLARAVEQLDRQARHMAGVVLVGAAGVHQTPDAALTHAGVAAGGVGTARQVVHEQAVAQACLAQGRHPLQADVVHQGLEHDGAGDHDVGAVGVEAGHLAAIVE